MLSCPGAAGAGTAASVGEAGRRIGVRGAGAREGDTAEMRATLPTRWVQEAWKVEAPEKGSVPEMALQAASARLVHPQSVAQMPS